MEDELLQEPQDHMGKSLDALRAKLATVRTGRANPSIIEHVQVEYYGSAVPLQQLASISSPDPRQLLVQPYDKSAVGSIEKAIRQSDLGFNPTNDGNLIRIAIPQLTEERRRDLVKLIHRYLEETKVAVRNLRRESNDHIRKLRKDNELTQDDEKRAQDQLQRVTDRFIHEIDEIGQAKEAEILEL